MGWSPDPMADNFLFLGCNWACFAVDLEEAGRFDENFGPGSRFGALGQETRMQVALRETGVKPVFVKEAIVNHSPHEDCVRVRWLLLRRYREGIHKGLMYPRRYAKQPDSYCLNKRVEVLRPVPLRGRWHIYGFFLTRLTAQLMEIAGIIKGRCVRILLIR